MRQSKLDKILTHVSKTDPDLNVCWAVDVNEFCKAFDIQCDSMLKEQCRHCKVVGFKPLLPFHFVSRSGENVVGIMCDHVDCMDVNGACCNPSIMVHIDEDSEFNKMTKELFKTMKG